jgi:hypothetical protein
MPKALYATFGAAVLGETQRATAQFLSSRVDNCFESKAQYYMATGTRRPFTHGPAIGVVPGNSSVNKQHGSIVMRLA